MDNCLNVENWDTPGALSIVVQGGLTSDNLVQTAVYCNHWRGLFPNAEIILAISVTDVLLPVPSSPARFRLVRTYRENGQFLAALAALETACDEVLVSPGALPLPPIKFGQGVPNNVNLQIAAAKTGLAAATGRYVLRVRSDLLFHDRRFLDQYAVGARMPRGDAATFSERVLVSWLFTLNPYTIERMPFHVSDWFHFGRLEDIRRIWDVAPMSFADAVYHRFYPHREHANVDERMIVPRLAVEQYVLFHCFEKTFPDLVLDSNDDWSSRERFIDLLVDNFNLCDLHAAGCIFDKYQLEFSAPNWQVQCITRDDWLAMAMRPSSERPAIMKSKRQTGDPALAPFPRYWPAGALMTKLGVHSTGEILSRHGNGILLHGPYVTILAGRYLAMLHMPICRGTGTLVVRATLQEGRHTLAERKFALSDSDDLNVELPFELLGDTGHLLEIVCEIIGTARVIVTGLTVATRPETERTIDLHYDPSRAPLVREVGEVTEGGVRTDGRQGYLVFGPWIDLPAGNYTLIYRLSEVVELGNSVFDVVAPGLNLSKQKVTVAKVPDKVGARDVVCKFSLQSHTPRTELRIFVDAQADFVCTALVLQG